MGKDRPWETSAREASPLGDVVEHDRPRLMVGMIKRAQENEEVDAVADKFSAPTYTDDIAEMLVVTAVGDGTQPGVTDPGYNAASDSDGILHFTSAGECSWQEYAQWALDCCQEIGLLLKGKIVGARKLKDMTNWVARRPVYSVLSSAKYAKLTGRSPRTWREAVADYIRHFYSKK